MKKAKLIGSPAGRVITAEISRYRMLGTRPGMQAARTLKYGSLPQLSRLPMT